MKKKIAIIPARGGSKRIPKKNIKYFLGKPIIAYSIEAALKSEVFDEVMVSTDDSEIEKVALQYGAKVPFLRSIENANDFATTFDVIEEVIASYKLIGESFDYGCCIYPTAPLVTSEKLKDFFDFFKKNKFDCVFPVLKYSYPIQRALIVDSKKKMSMISPEHIITRSQDLQQTYHDSGQFYWFDVNKLLKEKSLWTKNTGVNVISEMEAQDIDNIQDWSIAEFKYKYSNE